MGSNEADGPFSPVHRLRRRVNGIGAAILLLSLMGCCSTSTKPYITMPTPKVYTDDQVLKTFAERHGAIRVTANGILTDTIQELLRVKQQSQTTINVTATPAASTSTNSSTGGTTSTAPGLPTLTDLLAPNNFGLPAEGSLRKRIALDQNITGYELLYLGDNDLLSKEKQAILLRIDLSVKNFTKVKSFLGSPQFVMAGFSARARKAPTDEFSDTGVSVYTLQPEYTSVVAQESLLSSRIENYTAQATSGTITGGGSYQRGFEEGFLSLVETPIQYSIYTNKPNRFAFAFGPRRRINKRSWINPQRMFGETYEIQYELEPGSRAVFALLAMPKDAMELEVIAFVHEKLVGQDLIETDEALQPLRQGLTNLEQGKSPRSGPPVTPAELPAQPAISCPTVPKDTNFHCFTIPILKTSTAPAAHSITPTTVYRGVPSQLFITATEPVSSETEVFLGPLVIPKTNVTVLGRYRLKVVVPTNDDAMKNVAGGAMQDLEVILVTPDRAPVTVGKVAVK